MPGDDPAGERAATATATTGGRMLARRWTIAANYRDPADYGVPGLPDWSVYRDADGGLVLADDDGTFVAAAEPVRVRR